MEARVKQQYIKHKETWRDVYSTVIWSYFSISFSQEFVSELLGSLEEEEEEKEEEGESYATLDRMKEMGSTIIFIIHYECFFVNVTGTGIVFTVYWTVESTGTNIWIGFCCDDKMFS
jgi:hypothetical protein